MTRDLEVAALLRELDASLIQLAHERAAGQKRLAKRASALADVDLSYSGILILETLSDRPVRVTELAESTQIPTPSITRQIQDLESKGLISRSSDEQDGRASIVGLSEKGLRAAEAVGSVRIERLQRALDGWEVDDLRLLKTAFARLSETLRGV
jgi:DNA-binding MarR family transcriptional regulator